MLLRLIERIVSEVESDAFYVYQLHIVAILHFIVMENLSGINMMSIHKCTELEELSLTLNKHNEKQMTMTIKQQTRRKTTNMGENKKTVIRCFKWRKILEAFCFYAIKCLQVFWLIWNYWYWSKYFMMLKRWKQHKHSIVKTFLLDNQFMAFHLTSR